MPAEHVFPRLVLASDAHAPCCTLLHDISYIFEEDLGWRKRDCHNIYKWNSFRVQAVY